jgi:hypothetical protein
MGRDFQIPEKIVYINRFLGSDQIVEDGWGNSRGLAQK